MDVNPQGTGAFSCDGRPRSGSSGTSRPCWRSLAARMSSAYAATLKTLPDRISATIVSASQPGAGSSVESRTATTMQTGMMTARCRRTVLNRQPASVSSCLTQSLFSAGSRNPTANSSHLPTRGSPASRVMISVLQQADDLAGRNRLADLDRQGGYCAVLVRRQRLLHLHGLEHHDGLAGTDMLAFRGDDLYDRALHRADERVAVGRAAPGPAAPRPAATAPARAAAVTAAGSATARTAR